jgi:hypothetical protein
LQFSGLAPETKAESRIKEDQLQWEWKEVIRGLDVLQQARQTFSIPHSAYSRCFASGPRQRSGGTAYFAGTPVTASKPKMLLSLRKSFNAKNLTFQTVEDGLKPEERLQYAGAHRSQCKMGLN